MIFRIVVDPLYPPPPFYNIKKMPYDNMIDSNKFELIFDELEDGP